MPRFEQLSHFPLERQPGELVRQTMATRAMLERVWDERTAFQGITLQPDDAPSRGQCGVSSVWYGRHLEQQAVDVELVEGKIFVRDQQIGDDHVWLEVRGLTPMSQVVDLTSDQYQTVFGAAWHIGEYAGASAIIGRYQPEYRFAINDIPHRKLLARTAILQTKIDRLPPWRQVRIT